MSYPPNSRPGVPEIFNVTMTLADTEYSQELPDKCLTFIVHTRDETAFRLAFDTGYVATPTAPYFTVPVNSRYVEPQVMNERPPLTIYFASASAGKVIEILAWS